MGLGEELMSESCMRVIYSVITTLSKPIRVSRYIVFM